MYFPVSAIKYSDEGSKKEKKVILYPHLKALSTLIEQTRLQNLETADLIVSTTRKWREINSCYCSVPLSMYTLCHPSCRDTPILVTITETIPRRKAQRPTAWGNSEICQLTMNTNPHMWL